MKKTKSDKPQFFSVSVIELLADIAGMTEAEAGIFIKHFVEDLAVADPRKARSKSAEMAVLRTLKYIQVGKKKTEKGRKKLAEIRLLKQPVESVTEGYGKVR